uniref:Putative cell adhesion molecule ixodes scapularis cell adhesion molecule n=1 Tax=Ixodes ricinus TaxID=34613 RepID=A0A090XFE4_IXORI
MNIGIGLAAVTLALLLAADAAGEGHSTLAVTMNPSTAAPSPAPSPAPSTAACDVSMPDFHLSAVSARKATVQLVQRGHQEGWTKCACAINSLLVSKMKDIACQHRGPCQTSNGTEISMEGLTAGTNYSVCVRYQCPGGGVSPVTCQHMRTEAEAGGIVNVTVGGVSSTEANVSWTALGTLTDFRVTLWRIQKHKEKSHVPVTTLLSSVPRCRFSQLAPWTPYRVEVLSSTERGPVGGSAVFKTPATAPTEPRQLALVNATSTSLSLKWERPEDARGPLSGYTVFYGPSQDNRKRSSLATNSTAVTLDGLTANTEFEVYVKAFNELADGTEVASQPVRILARTDIGAPSKVQQLRLVSTSKNSVVVEWSAPLKLNGPLDGYLVYRCNRSAQLGAVTNHSECHTLHPGKATRVSVAGLDPESGYTLAVSAYNLRADRHTRFEGAPETIDVETLPEAPSALSGLDVRILSPDSVEVAWEAPGPGVSGYVVAWCQDRRCLEESVQQARVVIHGPHSDSEYNVRRRARSGPTAEGTGYSAHSPPSRSPSRSPSIRRPPRSTLMGTIVCSVLIMLMAGLVFFVCRKKKGTGPQLYKTNEFPGKMTMMTLRS